MHFSAEDLRPHRDARVDVFLAGALQRSRVFVQELIAGGHIVLAPHPEKLKPSYRIHPEDTLEVKEDRLAPVSEAGAPRGQAIPLDILFEDEEMIVLNKPPGLVVHPAVGHADGTLVNALIHHCGDSLAARGGDGRPGIVHRLDKDTSGVMVVAKTDLAHERIAAQFAERQVDKVYQALCWGRFARSSGICSGEIGRHKTNRQKMAVVTRNGRHARTDYRVLKQGEFGAWIECDLHTGRTHQIRVHLSHLGHPIAGDAIYGKSKLAWGGLPVDRQMLHATRLSLAHPVTGEELEFAAPLPKDFQKLLDRLTA